MPLYRHTHKIRNEVQRIHPELEVGGEKGKFDFVKVSPIIIKGGHILKTVLTETILVVS